MQIHLSNLITISVMRFVGGKCSGFFGNGGGTAAVVSCGGCGEGVIPVAECKLLTWFIDVVIIMLWLLLLMAGDAESTC